MNIKKILNKPLCITLLCLAFVYGLVLPFCWGNNPLSATGTLSLLCENRKVFFWIWGMLTAVGTALNTEYLFEKFGNRKKYLDFFLLVALLGMITVAATLGHSIAGWNPKRVTHWIGTAAYIAFVVASLILYGLHNFKKGREYRVILISVVAILALFLVMFLGFGKSGLMEMVPNALIEIFLFVANFTPALTSTGKKTEK